jgi:hypothetical protein
MASCQVLVVLDGIFTETDSGVRFHEATHFSADDAGALAPVLQRRILRLFQRRGLLDEHTVDDMLTWQGTGGFSVDAAVRIHGSDRAGRERLIRYCARPPFALDRLRIEREPGARRRPAGAGDAEPSGSGSTPTTSDLVGVRRVFYQPARPTPDGCNDPGMSEPEDGSPGTPGDEPAAHFQQDSAATLAGDAARSRWARLLARIYEVFPLRCPDCGSDMRILAFLTDPGPVGAILRCLDLPHTAPRLSLNRPGCIVGRASHCRVLGWQIEPCLHDWI